MNRHDLNKVELFSVMPTQHNVPISIKGYVTHADVNYWKKINTQIVIESVKGSKQYRMHNPDGSVSEWTNFE